jgi:hypothetical protein
LKHDDPPDQGQADAGAEPANVRQPDKWLEDALEHLGRNPDARIPDAKRCAVVIVDEPI